MFKKFAKYFMVSMVNGCLTFGLMYLFTSIFGIHYMLSAGISVVILVLGTFTVNNIWTWKRKTNKDIMTIYRFLKYCISGLITTSFGLGTLYLITEYGHIVYIVSYILASLLIIILAFLLNNFWTWGNSENKELDFIISILKKTKLILIVEKLGVK